MEFFFIQATNTVYLKNSLMTLMDKSDPISGKLWSPVKGDIGGIRVINIVMVASSGPTRSIIEGERKSSGHPKIK